MTYDTFKKWQCNIDVECQMMVWLDSESGKEGQKKAGKKLNCKACANFMDKIWSKKNFSDK